ncbi:carbamate kinase [Sulfitobacter sabulilitoris]|uniref:Carbamate kinase n=1 Tax=Sulfitobacter sabulilitoris TaxID=2562655 RepID=A0A5S3PKX0_9RHOB|nr:carbamate kinase [Sulfitobacter sabulilitoris]TMM54200.1 carbamate kinase [Sulfitobacter sabulilitoris]
MLVVAALGGNALLRRGQALTADNQRRNARLAAGALARIVRAGHDLVITHGNGPQVGLLALQALSHGPEEVYPLDVMGAETEGMIGYLIEQELENALGHDRTVATLLTQVRVDPGDPAFATPTKFVGPVYDRERAEALAGRHGWSIARDGDHWRRVVPSPAPLDIPDLKVIRQLLVHGTIVICAGGGGIPVVARPGGALTGIEAVIDKDAASALLADMLGADGMLLLTDVDGVERDFGTDRATRIEAMTPDEAAALDLPQGSMGPKVAAACQFARVEGRWAGIGRLESAFDVLQGHAGTRISMTPATPRRG